MRKIWHERAWDDYLWWQKQDRQKLKRINRLIMEIERSDGRPIGQAEILRGTGGLMSARIDHEHRLVYAMDGNDLIILSCKGHYR